LVVVDQAVLVIFPEMVLPEPTRFLAQSHLLVVVWEPVIKTVLPELVVQAVLVGVVVVKHRDREDPETHRAPHHPKVTMVAMESQLALMLAVAVEAVLRLLVQMVLQRAVETGAMALHL
jgi:hypothetical protein